MQDKVKKNKNMNSSLFKITFALFLSFVVLRLFAQEVKQSDALVRIDKENRPAVATTAETLVKPLQKEWVAYLKKNFKIKAKSNKNTVIARAAIISTLSLNPVNIYTEFEQKAEKTVMTLAVELSDGQFVSKQNYSDEYKKIKSLAYEFVVSYMKDNYNSLIKKSQKEVNSSVKQEIKIQKRINALEKKINKDSDNIQKLQKSIDRSKLDIEKNKKLLPEINKETEKKRAVLKELQDKKGKL